MKRHLSLNESIEILLVEDNPGDIELILMAFRESNFKCKITTVEDGQEALDYILKKNKYKNAKTPYLILLDINLPKVNGLEILKTIKKDKTAKKIPVIMLTTSINEEDILKAYNNYANAYVNKPIDYSEFIDTVNSISTFWFDYVKIAASAF